jgi:cellulase/cellobiase CelA1
MIWLNHNGPVQPFGSEVASDVSIGGASYNVWEGSQGSFDTVSYTMTTGTTSVSGLDLAPLVQNAVSRGYTSTSWYLIDIEAGFELWQGGAGLATNSFSVEINGAPPVPATCSGTYSVASSWSGGFQGQVVVTDTGNSPVNGWALGWTFPSGSGQEITSLWGGSYTQSGQAVSVTSAPYNGTIEPGSSVTIGFNASDSGTPTPPASVACT